MLKVQHLRCYIKINENQSVTGSYFHFLHSNIQFFMQKVKDRGKILFWELLLITLDSQVRPVGGREMSPLRAFLQLEIGTASP